MPATMPGPWREAAPASALAAATTSMPMPMACMAPHSVLERVPAVSVPLRMHLVMQDRVHISKVLQRCTQVCNGGPFSGLNLSISH